MNSYTTKVAVLLSVVALFCVAGCAKNELVKKEGEVIPATTQSQPSVADKNGAAESVSDKAVPAPTAEAAESDKKEEQRLETIYFNFDSWVLSQEARDTLARSADRLLKEAADKVQIEGHCDERGSDAYNLALGEKRARSAMQYLVNLGIAPERLTVISYGLERPAVQGSTEDAWARNRRAEFVVVK